MCGKPPRYYGWLIFGFGFEGVASWKRWWTVWKKKRKKCLSISADETWRAGFMISSIWFVYFSHLNSLTRSFMVWQPWDLFEMVMTKNKEWNIILNFSQSTKSKSGWKDWSTQHFNFQSSYNRQNDHWNIWSSWNFRRGFFCPCLYQWWWLQYWTWVLFCRSSC